MIPWTPKPGDRIRTVVTKDQQNEMVYLNDDNTITSLLTDEFLILTSNWVPWPHQIVDFLSAQRGLDRRKVLGMLMKLDRSHSELDFDQLCQKLVEELTAAQDCRHELSFSSISCGTIGQQKDTL